MPDNRRPYVIIRARVGITPKALIPRARALYDAAHATGIDHNRVAEMRVLGLQAHCYDDYTVFTAMLSPDEALALGYTMVLESDCVVDADHVHIEGRMTREDTTDDA
jgi:hypothetical protein